MTTDEESAPTGRTAVQLEEVHRRLLAAIERARSDLRALTRDFDTIVEASAQSNADDEHDPEGATIAFERAQVSSLIERALAGEAAAAQAIDRWESGAYGHCEICGNPISYERLLARPATTRCIEHAGR